MSMNVQQETITALLMPPATTTMEATVVLVTTDTKAMESTA